MGSQSACLYLISEEVSDTFCCSNHTCVQLQTIRSIAIPVCKVAHLPLAIIFAAFTAVAHAGQPTAGKKVDKPREQESLNVRYARDIW